MILGFALWVSYFGKISALPLENSSQHYNEV